MLKKILEIQIVFYAFIFFIVTILVFSQETHQYEYEAITLDSGDTLTKDEALDFTHEVIGEIIVPDVDMDVPLMQAKGSGTDNDAMIDSVAHDATTGLPGDGEPIVVAGHRHLAFNKLYDMEEGMIIIVKIGEENYYYKVTKVGFFEDDAVDTVFGGDEEVLRLYTCYPRARYSYITGRFGVEAERLERDDVPMMVLIENNDL